MRTPVVCCLLAVLAFSPQIQSRPPRSQNPGQRLSALWRNGSLPSSRLRRGQRSASANAFSQSSSPIFGQTPTYGSGGYRSNSVAVGDFNGDGKPDLAVLNSCSDSACQAAGSVGVLLGNGDGTYQAAVTYASGGYSALSVAVGDFNRDGKLDLAVLNECAAAACVQGSPTSGSVTILLGNGDGTFQAATTYNLPGLLFLVFGSDAMAVADLRGNGLLDLVVAIPCKDQNSCNYLTGLAGEVAVLLGNGDGTFQAASTYDSAGPGSVTVGDFNGDGRLDLAVAANSDYHSGSVGVFLGNGDGTFQTGPTYPSGGTNASSVAAGDFNGDGKLDLAVANECLDVNCFEGGPVGVLLGNGDGTFQLSQTYVTGSQSTISVAVGDFNGDGKLDLVATNECSGTDSCVTGPFEPGELGVLLGNGDGTFQPAQVYIPGPHVSGVAVADLNGDHALDIVAANFCLDLLACAQNGGVGVLLGNGSGTFQGARTYAFTQYLRGSAVGDLNGDGKLDLIVGINCCPQSVEVMLGNGDGTFQPATSYELGNSVGAVTTGDFNGDGKLDVAVAGCNPDCSAASAAILLGNGDGTLQPAKIYSLPGGGRVTNISVADLRGNGTLDLLVTIPCSSCSATKVSYLAVLLGNGDGTFQAAKSYQIGEDPYPLAVVGDFNGDGKPDVAAMYCSSNNSCTSQLLAVFLGKGDGTFQAAMVSSARGIFGSLDVGDFNGDGNLDLVVGAGNGIGLLLGNGDGTFGAVQIANMPLVQTASVADVNGDGKPDLLVANSCNINCSNLGVLLGNGDGTFQDAGTYLSGSSGSFGPAVGDFNRDGKLDVAWGGVFTETVFMNVGPGGLDLRVAPGSSPTATVKAGATAKYELSIGGGGMSGTATLACTGAPSGATCSLPGTADVSATSAGEFTVSVATKAASASLRRPENFLQSMWATLLLGIVLLPGYGLTRHSTLRRWGWLPLLLILFLPSCGGNSGGSSGGSGGPGSVGTTYNLKVTATMNGTMQSQSLKLIVQ